MAWSTAAGAIHPCARRAMSVHKRGRTASENGSAGAPDLSQWRTELLDPDSWGEILGKYGRTMKVAVALTDIHGNLLGPCHNPQPVWSVARQAMTESGLTESGLACAFCLAPDAPCNAVATALA